MMYLGLALQKRLKEGICSLPVLLVHLLFNELSVSNLCMVHTVQQLGRLESGANAPAYLPAKHLVFSVFLSVQDCMRPGVEWG